MTPPDAVAVAKIVASHPRARAIMALVKAGVPWEVAEQMTPGQLLGFRVIAGELEGGEFDWPNLQWRPPKT